MWRQTFFVVTIIISCAPSFVSVEGEFSSSALRQYVSMAQCEAQCYSVSVSLANETTGKYFVMLSLKF
jgi:hypothetical protein